MRITPAIIILLFAAPVFAAAVSPLYNLSDAEKSYYDKVFVYTMDNIKAGDKYDWASYSGKGSLKVSESYVSKSGSTCRNFDESFTVQGQSGGGKGVACKRAGDDGWCKLKPDNALTCAMENNGILVGLPNISGPNVTVPSVGGNANVTINAPSTPNAPQGPNMNSKPGGKPTGAGVADSVTSAAGSVAGPATGGGLKWFQDTFR